MLLVCRVVNFNTSSVTLHFCRSLLLPFPCLHLFPSVCLTLECSACPSPENNLKFHFLDSPQIPFLFGCFSYLPCQQPSLEIWQSINLHCLSPAFISSFSSQQFSALYWHTFLKCNIGKVKVLLKRLIEVNKQEYYLKIKLI